MNFYFLFSSMLLIILAFAHAIWGERKVFPKIQSASLDDETYLSVYIPWHQSTWIVALSGVFMFLAAIWEEGLTSLVIFILLVLTGNLVVFLLLSWQRDAAQLITKSVFQVIMFGTVIILILIGLF